MPVLICVSTPEATPCDSNGNALEEGSLASPFPHDSENPNVAPGTTGNSDWEPFENRLRFEWADFIFRRSKMSKANTHYILQLLATTLRLQGDDDGSSIFKSIRELYDTIDSVKAGDVSWQSCRIRYRGDVNDNSPIWMTEEHEVWFRDPLEVVTRILANPDFNGHMDYTPYREYGPDLEGTGTQRRWKDFMSGDWAWEQAVSVFTIKPDSLEHFSLIHHVKDIIVQDNPTASGSTFVPIIAGSDKTTVSVATGQNDFYPLYLSIGNIDNETRQKHGSGLVLLGFLPIAKCKFIYLCYPCALALISLELL